MSVKTGLDPPERPVTHRGFSLVELLIVVTVIGLALAVATPNFVRFGDTLALQQARAQLVEDLRMARQLAITRHSPVIVAFGNGTTTTNVTAYSTLVDANGDGAAQAGERRFARTLPRRTRLATVTFDRVDSLLFDPSGVLLPGTSGGQLALASSAGPRDTLLVSAAGVVYRP
jgi:prepilin-type N-terminal cleavage/methylation domain-containing protein